MSRVGCRDGRKVIDFFSATGLVFVSMRWIRSRATGGSGINTYWPYGRSIELAERLVGLRPGANWAMFGKNGTESHAARAAARATGRAGICERTRTRAQ